jgi:hypothetical protein
MKFIYYVDGKKYTTDNADDIYWRWISSPNEDTPAFENTQTGEKYWCNKWWIYHRLSGPVYIWSNGKEGFWLNDKHYDNIKEWIKDHPNPDFYFHKIGVFTETDKILWYLKN